MRQGLADQCFGRYPSEWVRLPGVRNQAEEGATLWQYFNPRSHERSDSNIAQKICLFLYNTDNKYIIR